MIISLMYTPRSYCSVGFDATGHPENSSSIILYFFRDVIDVYIMYNINVAIKDNINGNNVIV